MKKIKQILALLGVLLLLMMYGATLFFAMSKNPDSGKWFMASVYCTIAVPVLLYAYALVYRLLKNRNGENQMNNQQPKVKNVIFDVGKVLVDFDWHPLLKDYLHFDEKTCKIIEEAVFLSPLWNEMDRGVMSQEDIMKGFYANAPEYISEINQVIENVDKTITLRDFSVSWIKNVKSQGLHTYVLSNYAKHTFEKTKDILNFIPYMDGCIWSYEWKLVKPNPEIYKTLLKEFHLKAEECVFIDDLQANLDAARKLGFYTIRFTTLEEVSKKLELLGVHK